MAQFTIFKSSDTGAPTLSGTVGDLVNLLDKCLVTGYGSQTAAGWTKPLTGTNKAAFKSGAGTGFYLRVQDDGPGAGGATEARITGYETMSDVDTGTGPFPTAALGVNLIAMYVARKSATADATTRDWIVVADSRTVYVLIKTGDVAGGYFCFMFGDIYSVQSGDAYNCAIVGRQNENSASANNEALFFLTQGLTGNDAIILARGYTGVGGAVACGRHSDLVKAGSTNFVGVVPFPNPSDGATLLSRVWVHDPTTTPVKNIRGRLRGIWHQLHALGSFTDGDTITGSGELAGKTFLMIKTVFAFGGASGVAAIETSNTLETN